MILYIDIILFENVIMNFIILLATGTICKVKFKYFQMFLASLIGGLYAIMLYISNSVLYTNLFMKLLLSICIIYIAFKAINFKTFFKQWIIFYLTSFCFGGVAYYLLYGVNPNLIKSMNRCFSRKLSYQDSNTRWNFRFFYFNNFI